MLTALLALAQAVPSPIPLGNGAVWEYRESYAEQHAGIAAIEDTATRFRIHRTKSGGYYVTQRGGADPASGPVERGPDWIKLLPWTGEDALPLPLREGSVGPGSSPDHPGWKVEAEEEVSVPAGTFKAWRCTIRSWTNESILWIAPGVGIVKETQGTPRRQPEIERVLVRWSPGGE